jgi:hypothetical protein
MEKLVDYSLIDTLGRPMLIANDNGVQRVAQQSRGWIQAPMGLRSPLSHSPLPPQNDGRTDRNINTGEAYDKLFWKPHCAKYEGIV